MSERLAGTSFSLLKYDNPVLVREPSDGNKKRVSRSMYYYVILQVSFVPYQ